MLAVMKVNDEGEQQASVNADNQVETAGNDVGEKNNSSFKKHHQEKKRAQMVDWIFSFTAVVPSLPDLPFSAVDILDCSLMEHAERIYELSDEENRPVLVAAVKLAATKEMGSVNGKGLGAKRHRRRSTLDPIKVIESAQLRVVEQLGCEAEEIKHWEEEHAKILDVNTNAPTHMQSTHLVQKLRESLTTIEGLMKPGQVKSGRSMIETLASFAVSKATLKRHDALLLTSAIMRIAIDIFTSRCQLKEPINSATIKCLFGEKIEQVAVPLELLDWILSNEMILPALTEKIKVVFGLDLAALKSRYLESATKKPEGIIEFDAAMRKTRRSLPLTLRPSRGHAKIDAVRTGIPGREVAAGRSLSVSHFKEPTIRKVDQETKRAQMVDWIFAFATVVPRFPDLTFSAVDILDCSLMEHAEKIYKLSDEESQSVWIAAVKLATLALDEVALCALRSAIDKLGCEAEDIKHCEDEHAKTVDISTNASTHMQSTHLVQKLRESLTMIEGLMKPDQFQSGWSMIETLVSFAVSNASLLKRHDVLLLTSAIMRITLEFFAGRRQLKEPINSVTIKCLFGEKIKHVVVALELLDWILSDEMLCPALTEKMKDAKSEFRKISRQMQIICDVLTQRSDLDK